jgi:dihydropteroate synthase
MGVLNATPDSFFDGGRFDAPEHAIARAKELLDAGADILDIGGESTRPGSLPVSASEQLRRIEPALAWAVADGRALVSVDTTDPEVARHALALGAHIVNDVSCLRDSLLARVTADAGAVLILMHSREPMSEIVGYSAYPDDGYADVVNDVLNEWRSARDRAVESGMPTEHVWIDPGIGFAKNARHSFELLRRLDELTTEGVPLVVGPSRKSFITLVDDAPPAERLGGTIAACLHAAASGARVLRVHDVRAVRQALAVASAARRPSREEASADAR